jgi:hypothetical protein
MRVVAVADNLRNSIAVNNPYDDDGVGGMLGD